MKKLILVMAILLASSCAYAEVNISNALKSIPALKQGIAFSLADSKINYLMTTKIIEIGGIINVEGGYAGDSENTGNKFVGVLSVNLIEAGQINYPILKYIQFCPGVYAGFGNINIKDLQESEFDYGLSATLFEVKF